ncbi:MAG: monovalent cation/H(+) antiporter subunit G [Rhodospirillales bacterium]|nr:monovalent cation/H(+) antiporter subunit G [Rhodospirillales bacterium]MDE0381668.1 monovalent cation/H(+) antiporter subunit G [Rhodospirillales bacterium]
MIVDILSWISIGIGCAFVLVGGLGLVRLPDVFTRLHAASVADSAGAGFILLGLMLQAGLSLTTLKLVLILAFLIFTAPTAAHALAHAALLDGVLPWTRKPRDPAP